MPGRILTTAGDALSTIMVSWTLRGLPFEYPRQGQLFPGDIQEVSSRYPLGITRMFSFQKKPTKGLALHHVKVLRAELYRNWTCTLSSSASQALIPANPIPLSFNPTTTHNLLLVLESQNLDLTNVVRVYLVEPRYE